ncbi:MAG: 2-phospho-L-lactate guanylyltransferase (CobY/MobA/RfbA family) [Salinirussus sp.]|jgi:2-phospho-L-lactate guanylyltransferase (CobY/MobA/RfbA family)
MTVLVVLADPPEPGVALPGLAAGTPLSAAETARLYEAMLVDVCRTAQAGGADVLVNYRSADQVPVEEPETALREALTDELEEPTEARYEVQVGETFAGRVGNTVTHLLEEEGERQVGVTTPAAPFLRRDHVGGLGMSLRTEEVALAPARGGRVALAGFTDTVDFEDAFAAPAVETLAMRARDAGLSVDFLPRQPLVETPADLADAVAYAIARVRAERLVPGRTVEVIRSLGLRAVEGDGEARLAVDRESNDT